MNIKSVNLMEPMMPEGKEVVDALLTTALEIITLSERLTAKIPYQVQIGLGDMVRQINCYYSNFIEGHNTHPIDIEKALKKDFSDNPIKRNLQLEAIAHITLQKKIDEEPQLTEVTSPEYFLWLHREFCSALPEEMLWVVNPETKERKRLIPGEFRTSSVQIGAHIPIEADCIASFLRRFQTRYDIKNLNRLQQIIAVAASHHRFLWIHPFYDGNGRVARLFSHAFLKQIGIGNSLWSISRGLARNHSEYKNLFMAADGPRQGNYDGRGALTQKGLNQFCAFFLNNCLDQILFMEKILAPEHLLGKMERWTQEQMHLGQLPAGSFFLLKEALLRGSFERGQASTLTSYKERQARTILQALTTKELLISDSPKGAVRLAFPSFILEEWFPRLFLG